MVRHRRNNRRHSWRSRHYRSQLDSLPLQPLPLTIVEVGIAANGTTSPSIRKSDQPKPHIHHFH
jgi:hypothetical protein